MIVMCIITILLLTIFQRGNILLEINGEGFAPIVLKEKVEINDY